MVEFGGLGVRKEDFKMLLSPCGFFSFFEFILYFLELGQLESLETYSCTTRSGRNQGGSLKIVSVIDSALDLGDFFFFNLGLTFSQILGHTHTTSLSFVPGIINHTLQR